MMTYPKRLIEVDLPIARISAHARREKSIRHGHISTLHIWWARRPLAACRAVVCASLWPDPVDLDEWGSRGEAVQAGSMTIHPQRFLSEARAQMARRVSLHLTKASSDSLPRLFSAQKDPSRLDDPIELRGLLLDFIADFADWDNSTDPDYLAAAATLTQAAHEAMGGEPEARPLVVDPFAGGGSIPLEALRVGASTVASDLNPVAVLLNKVILEYIPKYGRRLADEIRRTGEEIAREAEIELAGFYPSTLPGEKPIAYLWARTIISGAPGETIPVEIPLIRSMWLCKKPSRKRALRWVRGESGAVQTETVDVTYADGMVHRVRRPLLEVFEPALDADVDSGTAARGTATCPVTGMTDGPAQVRQQLKSRHGGVRDARLLCVVTLDDSSQGRSYRLPTAVDMDAVGRAVSALELRSQQWVGPISLIPDEPLPIMSGVFNAPLYGHSTWGSLFSVRQALAMTTYAELVARITAPGEPPEDPGLQEATAVCMALAVSRLADRACSLCTWRPQADQEKVEHTFTRQALPMTWDFAEATPLTDGTGSWADAYDHPAMLVENLSRVHLQQGTAIQANAQRSSLPDDAASAVITDPPYYNAVPYADLSDFFYVWLRRALGRAGSFASASALTPKDDEICEMAGWDPLRYPHKNAQWFEDQMTSAMSECRRVLHPSGLGVVVFAHKSTSGWEAQLLAMITAGFVVTASWPIDTEMGSRLRAHNSAVLASSIHLVCRPRENPDGSVRDDVGEWREVLAELPLRIREWMPRLAREGVVGADAIFACLGPALEVFSRHSRVEKASGEAVTLREYLEQVWAAVSREALSMIFDDPDTGGLEPDARLTAMWLWTLGSGSVSTADGSREDYSKADMEQRTTPVARASGYTLEFDAARKIAQGLGIHLDRSPTVVEVQGDKARLLQVVERTHHLFGKVPDDGQAARKPKKTAQMDLFAEVLGIDAAAPSFGSELATPEPGRTILDRVHQAMILFGAGRGEALKRFLIEDGIGKQANFWKLAQALSALYPMGSDEKRWVDGVLARKKGLGL